MSKDIMYRWSPENVPPEKRIEAMNMLMDRVFVLNDFLDTAISKSRELINKMDGPHSGMSNMQWIAMVTVEKEKLRSILDNLEIERRK